MWVYRITEILGKQAAETDTGIATLSAQNGKMRRASRV